MMPRLPRLGRDYLLQPNGTVVVQCPPGVKGASAFADPGQTTLTGHFHCLPKGTVLPVGLAAVADGADVDPGSRLAPGHHSIYPTSDLTGAEFEQLFKDLPWVYTGKKH